MKYTISKAMLKTLMEINNGSLKVFNSNTTFALEERGLITRHLASGLNDGEQPNRITEAGKSYLENI